MFKEIIFWCEFPEETDWKLLNKLLNKVKLKITIYLACKTIKEFEKWKNIIKSKNIELNVWPILEKNKGYWFSGFTNKKDIDKLKQFKGLKIKVDLEPPLPKWQYRNHRIFFYGIKQLFRIGKNKDYLKNVIYDLARENEVEEVANRAHMIANEFPIIKWYLERQGLYMDLKKNMTKNIMCYTTFAGRFFRPFLRLYLKYFMKEYVNKDKNIMFSIGLIGSGILKTERIYDNIKQFDQDLKMVESSGVDKVAIYSIEGLLKRENPEEWLNLIKTYAR